MKKVLKKCIFFPSTKNHIIYIYIIFCNEQEFSDNRNLLVSLYNILKS